MDHLIISFILLVLAAKAEGQTEDNLAGTRRGQKSEADKKLAHMGKYVAARGQFTK
jgi:hypothetical protein